MLVSTPVSGDLSISPEIEVGRDLWFEECSKIHMMVYNFGESELLSTIFGPSRTQIIV